MFTPEEHLIELKGKKYLQVMWRLVWFREVHPDWGIDTQALELTDDKAIFKAVITDESGLQKSVGHGSESKKDFGDFIEKAETKAVGRALAMCGFGTQFVGEEFDEGERIVDSPVKAQDIVRAEMKKAYKETRQKLNATDEQMSAMVAELYKLGRIAKATSKEMNADEFYNCMDELVAVYGSKD